MFKDGSEIKLAARIAAIEYMIGHLHKVVYGIVGATPEMIAKNHEQFREQLRREHFSGPGIHPTQSDMLSGEMEEAFDHLLKIIAEMTGAGRKTAG